MTPLYIPILHDRRDGWFSCESHAEMDDAASSAADCMEAGHYSEFSVLRLDFDPQGSTATDVTAEAHAAITAWHNARGQELPEWLTEGETE